MISIGRPVIELSQYFQAGIEAEFVVCPKLTSEAKGKFHLEVSVDPAEQVGSLIASKKEDENFMVKFTPKVPGAYNIKATVNGLNLHPQSHFTVEVNERRLEVEGELDLKGETFQNPLGIAVNSKGLVAVVDTTRHCILMFDKEGKYLRKFGCYGEKAGRLICPRGVTYINDDNILVADLGNHRIQQFDVRTGNSVKCFGKHGTGVGEFQSPLNVCMDDEGRVAVVDFDNNRIQVFTIDGELVIQFGDSGPGKLNRPTACIFLEHKFIVSDSRNHCLKVFDGSGKFLSKIGEHGTSDGQLNLPGALCVEKCGNHHNILVCDRNNHRVVQFSVEGSFTGKTVIKLERPMGIATTPDGRILVCDYHAKEIHILK